MSTGWLTWTMGGALAGFVLSGAWLVRHQDGRPIRRPRAVAHYAWGAVPFLAVATLAATSATRSSADRWLVAVVGLFAVWVVATFWTWLRAGRRTLAVPAFLAAGWVCLVVLAWALPATRPS